MDTGTRLTIWVMRGWRKRLFLLCWQSQPLSTPLSFMSIRKSSTKTEFTVAVKALIFSRMAMILIPLEKLYRKFTGGSLAVDTAHQGEIKNQIKFLVNFVEQTTGLQNFGQYLTSMLEIDAFFLNEDRHTNNIAVQYNAADDTYALCPLFDNGLSLLADTNMDFPLERSLEDCLKAVEAKPFSRYFDEQLDAAEELYGIQLHFNFSTNDVKALIDSYRTAYSQEICDRCEALIRRQMRHYGYLVK